MVEILCKELGVEVGEGWVSGNDNRRYRLTKDGFLEMYNSLGRWVRVTELLPAVLRGSIRPRWKPKINEYYYTPDIMSDKLYDNWLWSGIMDEEIALWYERGLIFENKDEAIERAKEMLRIEEER